MGHPLIAGVYKEHAKTEDSMIDVSHTSAESPSRFPLLFAWVQSGYELPEKERPGEKTAFERTMKKEETEVSL